MVPTRSRKACRVAQEEIAAGKIAYVKTEDVPVVKPEVEGAEIPKFAS
jgi:DNA-directed RNA polymerase subunit omega